MSDAQPQNLVLAVYPFSRGFAFVFFEGPESPFDWGVKELKEKHKNARTVEALRKLITRYRPEVLVVEDTSESGSRRTSRIRKLYRMLEHVAMAELVEVHRCRRSEIAECFVQVGALTKHEIAQAIAMRIPAFAHRLPPYRKPWMSEDPRQSLFDAVALALAFYHRAGRPDLRGPEES